MSELYNKNWHTLSIDNSNAINPNFVFDNLLIDAEYVDRKQHSVWGFNGDELTTIFTEQWLAYMKSINLEVDAMLIFYRKPHFIDFEAHIDYMYNNNTYPSVAINWVLPGDENSEMIWYETPADADQKPHNITPTGHGHTFSCWPVVELNELERYSIGSRPVAVRVDIPHSIAVYDHARWSITARCKTPPSVVSWKEIVEFIKPLIINESN